MSLILLSWFVSDPTLVGLRLLTWDTSPIVRGTWDRHLNHLLSFKPFKSCGVGWWVVAHVIINSVLNIDGSGSSTSQCSVHFIKSVQPRNVKSYLKFGVKYNFILSNWAQLYNQLSFWVWIEYLNFVAFLHSIVVRLYSVFFNQLCRS